MKNRLLQNVVYGNELPFLRKGNPTLWRSHSAAVADGEVGDWESIVTLTARFFRGSREGVFGGPITAGDALFVASFMARERPTQMIEIGVAAGFSSAFILYAADELGLLQDRPFLHSIDIASSLPDGNRIGQYVPIHYPNLVRHWNLTTDATSVELLSEAIEGPSSTEGHVLAFVDGGHRHPWPAVDAYCLSHVLSERSWILMQDYQMMERWYADSIEHDLPMGSEVRGVNLAVGLWPGKKVIGTHMAYNMAAIQVTDRAALKAYIQQIGDYEFECSFAHTEILDLHQA